MMPLKSTWIHLDGLVIGLYLGLVCFGWVNLYAVSYECTYQPEYVFLASRAGKQLLWIGITPILATGLLWIDSRYYRSLGYIFYMLNIGLLIATFIWGVRVAGHTSWLQLGPIRLQATELGKLTCALATAPYLDCPTRKLSQRQVQLGLGTIIGIPALLIALQGDIGSSLVFGAFVVMLYREGFPQWPIVVGIVLICATVLSLLVHRTYLIIAILGLGLTLIGIGKRSVSRVIGIIATTLGLVGFITGFDLLFRYVLKPYHQHRLQALVDPGADPLGTGWNVIQSQIAIGAGGFWGKGFLQGTQTRYGFVSAQKTDFIFCTIGEEYGWAGSVVFIGVFVALLLRIFYLAERQRLRFVRVYGYGVGGVLLMHFMINVGMTISLVPVIGIPLPFISYGGSALCSFSMMLWVLLRLDSEQMRK